MSRHRYDGQESTYTFMQGLRNQPGLLDEIAAGIGELARQAEQDQPVHAAIAQEMAAAAKEVSAVARDADEWYAMCKTDEKNRRDAERVESPRKSARVERNADVGTAIRDM